MKYKMPGSKTRENSKRPDRITWWHWVKWAILMNQWKEWWHLFRLHLHAGSVILLETRTDLNMLCFTLWRKKTLTTSYFLSLNLEVPQCSICHFLVSNLLSWGKTYESMLRQKPSSGQTKLIWRGLLYHYLRGFKNEVLKMPAWESRWCSVLYWVWEFNRISLSHVWFDNTSYREIL